MKTKRKYNIVVVKKRHTGPANPGLNDAWTIVNEGYKKWKKKQKGGPKMRKVASIIMVILLAMTIVCQAQGRRVETQQQLMTRYAGLAAQRMELEETLLATTKQMHETMGRAQERQIANQEIAGLKNQIAGLTKEIETIKAEVKDEEESPKDKIKEGQEGDNEQEEVEENQ